MRSQPSRNLSAGVPTQSLVMMRCMEELGRMSAPASGTTSIESCASTWVFDRQSRRFCRILRDLESPAGELVTGWRPYASLDERDDGSFVVWLDSRGERCLRGHRHTVPCPNCHARALDPRLDDVPVEALRAVQRRTATQ